MKQTVEQFQVDTAAASLRKLVEEQLRRAILTRHFPPGAHLSDRVLCETFKVSRAVVREAVRQLEAENLVETVPHRGSFVKVLSLEDARQIYEVRAVLEALAAKGFARNATDEQIQQLVTVMSAITTLKGRTATEDRLIDLKQQFYAILFKGSRNSYVQTMLQQIHNRIALLRATTLSDPKRMPSSIAELGRIVAAIRRRDEEAAWNASLEHVRNAGLAANGILSRLGVGSDGGVAKQLEISNSNGADAGAELRSSKRSANAGRGRKRS